jgi:hypothetical protein
MSSLTVSIFLVKYLRSEIIRYALLKGAPALYDFFNTFKIALGVNSPATPIALNISQQTFILPSKECGARDIEAVADFVCFIFCITFALKHSTLSGDATYTFKSKHSEYPLSNLYFQIP